MADDKREISVDGCVLWLILLALNGIAGGVYAIAAAIKGLPHG
jgi:hypothetical protein